MTAIPRDPAPNIAGLRTLGFGSHQAMPGDTAIGGGGMTPDPVNDGLWFRTVGSAFVWEAIDQSDVAGLGNAALFDVGTGAGTVAAGDDSRIVGAAQAASLGNAAVKNVGTAAGTVAAGDDSRIAGAAPLADPVFTGNPRVPTPTPGDNDTSVASTAFVKTAIDAATGTPVSGTVDKAPVIWDSASSSWLNQKLHLPGMDVTGGVDDQVLTVESGAVVLRYPQKNRWAKARSATIEFEESIDAPTCSSSFTTEADHCYLALVPVTPGRVYVGMTVLIKIANAWGTGGTKALWAAVWSVDGLTRYKATANDTTTVLAASAGHDFTFPTSWTCPSGVYGAFLAFHCNPGTGGSPIQPTLSTPPSGGAGTPSDMGIGLTRRSAASAVTAPTSTIPSTVTVIGAGGSATYNNQTPYMALHT